MKKIFTLLAALIVFSSVFAQRSTAYDNRQHRDDYKYDNNRPDHAVVITNNNNRYQHDDYRYNDYKRRAEMERINRDYDKQINDYRNNRRLNAYERERNIQRIEKERNDKLKSFGGGVLVGGILGVLLGSHL